MTDKPLFWVGSALKNLRDFPDEARRAAGHELHLVQMGLPPSDWKPMASVGPGVIEVLHAFQKMTQKTPSRDIETGSKCYREVLQHRRGAEGGSHE